MYTKKYLEAEIMYSNRIAHDIVNFIAHLTGGFDCDRNGTKALMLVTILLIRVRKNLLHPSCECESKITYVKSQVL